MINVYIVVHPAADVCMPGAGCTLNFEHCHFMDVTFYVRVVHVTFYVRVVPVS